MKNIDKLNHLNLTLAIIYRSLYFIPEHNIIDALEIIDILESNIIKLKNSI